MAERIKIQIAEDHSGVKVEFLPESGATGIIELTREQLLKLVQGLGQVHKTLAGGKDIPSLEGHQIEAVFNTRWWLQPGLIGEAAVMSFQHPAYGPVGFAIPIDQAEYMVQLLSNQIAEAQASKASPQ